MPAAQALLFPDPKPLVERLGRAYFRALPQGPGVYLMRGPDDTVLYVGKAKNLRKRLGSYRVANPERLRRRQLRLLRAVVRIELEECTDEASALAREAELLRSLKPRFNRAGTWPRPARFLAWRFESDRLELAVMEAPEAGWRTHGPMGVGAAFLRGVLGRLLWFAVNPGRGMVGLPVGWARGEMEERVVIDCGRRSEGIAAVLEELFAGRMDEFRGWLESKLPAEAAAFEKAALAADLEWLGEFPITGADSSRPSLREGAGGGAPTYPKDEEPT